MIGDKYTPQVGDRVRLTYWVDRYVDVTHIGRDLIVGDDEVGEEVCYEIRDPWVKVEKPTPLPERWIDLDVDGFSGVWPTRERAEQFGSSDRVALVHIYTDSNGVDHADIERVTR